MPQAPTSQDVEVVDLESSDDDVGGSVAMSNTSNPLSKPNSVNQVKQEFEVMKNPLDPALECRSFWRAGDYDVGSISRNMLASGQLEHARVHPKFLHSNATSHKWAFGAIAELLDNAVDEVCNGATFVKVDKINMADNSPMLLFQDDGGGMDPDAIRRCMSLGYSMKKSSSAIGRYGNGFKTSTMRLGADVMVFSATCTSHTGKASQSVGLLSYTFLRKTGQDDVIVPMVDFEISGRMAEPIIYSSVSDWSANLQTILEWSPFSSEEELLKQFKDIGTHGTKIVIYNLWLNDEGIYELNFDDDDEDIHLRNETNCGEQLKLTKKAIKRQSHISDQLRYSLRAYASVLYMKKFTNFKIILRGQPVQQINFADILKYSKKFVYKPQLGVTSKEATVETTIGFIKEAPELNVSGFNVYHKNRLIRPFWKVHSDGSARGNGIVGFLEANFIEPAHDKQDFERSSLFIRLEARLRQMFLEYWKSHCHLIGHQPPGFKAQIFPKKFKTDKILPSNNPSISPSGTDFCYDGVDVESMSFDQIRQENIKLFVMCEEYVREESTLRRTIEDLEKELEQAKRKSAQLSAYLQSRHQQSSLKPQA